MNQKRLSSESKTILLELSAAEGTSVALYELVEAVKNLLRVYSNFTTPIMNTLAALPNSKQR